MKYIKEFREYFSQKPVFSLSDVKTHFSAQKIGAKYVHVLLNHLVKRSEIMRITRGLYTFKKDPAVLSFAFFPSYHGLQEALSLHGLWEQETNTVLVTPRKFRSGTRETLEAKVIIKRIKRSMFFGFEQIKHYELWIPVSDVEKTLIDFAYYNEPLDKKTLKEIRKKINKKKLFQYLKRTPEKTREKAKKLLGD